MGELPAVRQPERAVSITPEQHLKKLVASVAEGSMTRPQALMAFGSSLVSITETVPLYTPITQDCNF